MTPASDCLLAFTIIRNRMVASLPFALVSKPGLSALYPDDEWGRSISTVRRNLLTHRALREALRP